MLTAGGARQMTKAEIVQAIYTKLGGFSKKEAADLVDLVAKNLQGAT